MLGSGPKEHHFASDTNCLLRSGPPKGPGFFVVRVERQGPDSEVRAEVLSSGAARGAARVGRLFKRLFPSGGRAESESKASEGRPYLNSTEIVFFE
jgi:hypothetical protein